MQVQGWESTLRTLRERAAKQGRHIVVSDGEDERVLRAVQRLVKAYPNTSLRITLVCRDANFARHHRLPEIVEIRTPIEDPNLAEYAERYRQKRILAGKDVSDDTDSLHVVTTNEMYAASVVDIGQADGMLGGASTPTATVLRAGLQMIGLGEGRTVVSGCFFMLLPNPLPSGQCVLAFADCAVIPMPDSEQLCGIAVNTAETINDLFAISPVVAFLSFSTKGSARHACLQNIHDALQRVQNTGVPWLMDGELQADAAIIPDVASRKDPDGQVAGRANVLIFPDLNAANISYKLVERLAGVKALGVVLSGFAKPVNDLSRGCSTDDILDMICLTALQAAGM